MKSHSTETLLELLPIEIEEMFPGPDEVVVFYRGWDLQGSPLTAELTSYLVENDVKARPCLLEKSLGRYGWSEKSAEIFVLPMLISYFSDPNVNQVLCGLLASYIYDLMKGGKKTLRGAIGRWSESEKILSVRGYRCRETRDGIQLEIDNIYTNCHSPQQIADAFLRSPQGTHTEDIMVSRVIAINVGIDPLGGTDISHLTEPEVLNRIRDFLSLSVDYQLERMRSTIPSVRVFNPAISSSQFQDDSFLQVSIPVELYDQIYRAVQVMRLGREDSERSRLIAVAICS
ncbi:MAG: hypothetical protein ACLP5H_10900 [Desulfomonilaceae bacterium]